jgi:hypothetical protein
MHKHVEFFFFFPLPLFEVGVSTFPHIFSPLLPWAQRNGNVVVSR